MCVFEPAVGDIVPVALATSQMPDTIALPVISQRLLGCSALVAT